MAGKARQIPFSGPMVRALLDGRKTQTRRVAKLTAGGHVNESGGHLRWHPNDPDATVACPYGQPGDLLYVREHWATDSSLDSKPPRSFSAWPVRYLADDSVRLCGAFHGRTDGKHRRGMHMPRWASRLTLRITGVRLERLKKISEEDARWESIGLRTPDDFDGDRVAMTKACIRSRREGFAMLWDSLNADRGFGWDANPWVWVVKFEVIPKNVDDVLAERETA